MKSLFLIRHAKSSWGHPGLDDFDRPLNERGNRDAPEMAKRLLDKQIGVDVFVSSPAERAKKTAGYFAAAFGKKETDIIFIPSLYHSPIDNFTSVICGLDDNYQSAAIFSHNPAISAFVNTLTYMRVDSMPTCGVFALSLNTDHWKEFDEARKDFMFFDYPKAGQD